MNRISGGRGKGKEAESAGHFLLRPSFPQRTNFEILAQYGVFIERICSNKKMKALRIT